MPPPPTPVTPTIADPGAPTARRQCPAARAAAGASLLAATILLAHAAVGAWLHKRGEGLHRRLSDDRGEISVTWVIVVAAAAAAALVVTATILAKAKTTANNVKTQ